MPSGGERYCSTSFSAAELPPPPESLPTPLPLSPWLHAVALDSARTASTVLIVAFRLRIVRLLRQGVPARGSGKPTGPPARSGARPRPRQREVHAEVNSDLRHSEGVSV